VRPSLVKLHLRFTRREHILFSLKASRAAGAGGECKRLVIVISGLVRSLSAAFLVTVSLGLPAGAETIKGALAKAYENNSTLNSGRAAVRIQDEGVAIAKSGYRPTIEGSATASYASRKDRISDVGARLSTGSFGITINQNLFDGFRTKNSVAQAELQVLAEREVLRNTEQNILFDAASAYMDVIRDRKVAAYRKSNLAFLKEQVRAANARFEVGEGTRTDVAQANAGQSQAVAQLNAASAQIKASEATYRQVVGSAPGKLDAAGPLKKLMPKSLDAALQMAASEHPAIKGRYYAVDANLFGVKVAEGALLPTVSAQAGLEKEYVHSDTTGDVFVDGAFRTVGVENRSNTDTASIGLRLTVPIYSGGRNSALVRQQKERLGQARIDVDVAIDQVRSIVTSSWSQLDAAFASVTANKALVSAAQLALDGVVEERKVGQRTTLDVLNAQRDVTNARISLASAERDVVVGSFAVLSAMGRLNIRSLGLGVAEHKPEEHYKAVKDKWFGLRTPDGR
jgi:outer membrane protein